MRRTLLSQYQLYLSIGVLPSPNQWSEVLTNTEYYLKQFDEMTTKEGAAVDNIWEHREVKFDILIS